MPRKEDYEDTDVKGIKKRISDGKYIVTLDFGRQLKLNSKTGKMERKQLKLQKFFEQKKRQ